MSKLSDLLLALSDVAYALANKMEYREFPPTKPPPTWECTPTGVDWCLSGRMTREASFPVDVHLTGRNDELIPCEVNPIPGLIRVTRTPGVINLDLEPHDIQFALTEGAYIHKAEMISEGDTIMTITFDDPMAVGDGNYVTLCTSASGLMTIGAT
jgi:hypothetical protein